MTDSRASLRTDAAIALGIAVACTVAVLATGSRYGMAWDEAYYYPAYEAVARWVGDLFTHPGHALSADGIRAGWGATIPGELIPELPPVTKWIGAFGVMLTPSGGDRLVWVRLASALLFGGTVAAIFAIARAWTGRWWAAVAAAMYALHPRVFGHAHFAASETPMALLVVATVALATRDLSQWRWRIALGALMGIAVATKANGLILFGVVGVWLLVRALLVRAERPDARAWREDAIALIVAVVLAPLVALAVWPLLWHETGARLSEYAAFVTQHSHQGLWYLGTKWNFPEGIAARAPWHYPFVMAIVVTPEPFVLAALAAVGWVVVQACRRGVRFESIDVLLLGLAVAPLVALALPSSPKYDGERLFFPAFAPFALLVARLGGVLAPREGDAKPAVRLWLPVGAIVASVLCFVFPFDRGLSYYNATTRLVSPKGAEFPFEATYWCESLTRDRLEAIVDALPPEHRSIRTLAIQGLVFEVQRDWGVFPADVQVDGDPPYGAHLLQNRKGFWSNTEWWFFTNREPLAVWPTSGDPLLFLYDGRPPGVY